jgi:hypothetical protein
VGHPISCDNIESQQRRLVSPSSQRSNCSVSYYVLVHIRDVKVCTEMSGIQSFAGEETNVALQRCFMI